MAEEVISVKFIGEDGNLAKSLGTLQSQLKRFQDAMKAAGNVESLQRLQRAADATKARIEALNRAAAGGAAGAQKMSKDFTGLTRVIQDLPFGFVAISNNIEQLLPAAGGLGLAISSITAAITFASVGFGAWTRGFDNASKAAEKHVSAVQEAKKALETFVQSLEDVRQARVTGEQSAQKDLVSLAALYNATQNANIPLAKRRELVDALQEQYPKYFKNISDETILAGGAKSAYDRLTASILATAKARAAQDALVDIQKQVLAVEEQQVSAMQRQYDAFKNIDKISKGIQKSSLSTNLAQTGNAGAATVFNVNKVTQATEEYNDRLKESSKLNQQRNELLARAARLSGEITDITTQNPDTLLDPTGNIKTPKAGKFAFLFDFLPFDPNGKLKPEQQAELSKAVDAFSKQFGNVLQGVNFSAGATSEAGAIQNAKDWWEGFKKGIFKFKPPPLDIQAELNAVPVVKTGQDDTVFKFFQRGFQEEMDKQNIPLDLTLDKDQILTGFQRQFAAIGAAMPKTITTIDGFGRPITVPLNIEFNTAKIQAGLEVAFKTTAQKITELKAAMLNIVNTGIQNGAIAIGEGLGQALSGKGFEGIGSGIISVLGDVISQLGKKLIEGAAIIKTFKVALKGLIDNPIAALAVGALMVGIGGAIKASAANIGHAKGFAQGGLVFGPTLGMVGEGKGTSRSNPEVIAPLNKLQNFIGGGSNVNIPEFVEVRIHGDQLVGMLKLAEKARGRDR